MLFRSATVHEEDEVSHFARDEIRVPGLQSAKGDAEAVDLFRDRDDVVELRYAAEPRSESSIEETFEVPVQTERESAPCFELPTPRATVLSPPSSPSQRCHKLGVLTDSRIPKPVERVVPVVVIVVVLSLILGRLRVV